MSIFRLLNFLFLQPRRAFFPSRISLRIFSKAILPKQKSCKNSHGKKLQKQPLDKCQLFDFLNFLFLQPRKAFFRSRISLRTFSWPILPKKKSWKNGHFGPKPWVNRFGKNSIFRLFELLVFIAEKGVFSFQNIVKDIFPAYIL